MSGTRTLLAFDTDRIKDYVFATDALKEICGASAILDELNRNLMPNLVRQADPAMREIYANGGAGLFVVDASRAEEAQQTVEKTYRERSGGAASVTGAMLELPSGFEVGRGDIRDLSRLLQLRLRQSKDEQPVALAVTSLPHVRPCAACGEFPASVSFQEHGDSRLLCAACWRKRTQRTGGPWDRLKRTLPKGELPEDFTHLGELSRPKGYLGLLYADGNGLGREVEKQPTLDRLQQFAAGVDDGIHEATRAAIQIHLQPEEGRYPLVPLFLGGDDLVMVTRAQSALNVAITLVEKFAEFTGRQLGQRLSLSVGVVLAHAHFPFRVMLDLAESTLKFAKREGAKRQGAQGKPTDRGLINFLTVTSANHLDFKKFHAETLTYQPDPQGPRWLRTLRPYTPVKLRDLLAVAHALRRAPRGRLHALGECVFLSHHQSIIEGLTACSRWRRGAESGEKFNQVKALFELVNQAGTGDTVFPWRGGDKEWRTPLLDLVEIFEFVQEGTHAGTP